MIWEHKLDLRPLMILDLQLKDGWDVGLGPFGSRKVFGAESGTFKFVAHDLLGIEGNVVPGPADFSCTDTAEGILAIDVRALLETNSPKQYIAIRYANWIKVGEMLKLLYQGETISFDRSEFVVQPRFETGLADGTSPPNRLKRLDTTVALGHAELSKKFIKYRFYEVVPPVRL